MSPNRTPSLLSVALFSLVATRFASALSYVTNEQNANFDDLTQLTSGSQIGVYKTLHWNNLFIQQPDFDSEDPKHGGLYPKLAYSDDLAPQSPMACHDTLTTPLWGAARLSANYFGSRVALFDLRSFSFGCVGLDPNTHNMTTIPKPCAVEVKGYAPGREVNPFAKPTLGMTLWFTNPEEEEPTEETKMRMVRMDSLDKTWWALGTVTFEAVANGPVTLCVDDVSYRTYNVTKWGKTLAVPEHVAGLRPEDLR